MPTVISALDLLLALLRLFVFGVTAALLVLAALSAAVRARSINPFGTIGQFVRRSVDPLFVPMERRVLRAGGNPAHAPWWTVAASAVAGLAILWLVGFVRDQLVGAAFAMQTGPRGLLALLISWTFAVLRLALLVRVLSSWFQLGPWSKWVRWAFALTDWFIQPLRQIVPSIGMLDITPLVAYFALSLLEGALLRLVA